MNNISLTCFTFYLCILSCSQCCLIVQQQLTDSENSDRVSPQEASIDYRDYELQTPEYDSAASIKENQNPSIPSEYLEALISDSKSGSQKHVVPDRESTNDEQQSSNADDEKPASASGEMRPQSIGWRFLSRLFRPFRVPSNSRWNEETDDDMEEIDVAELDEGYILEDDMMKPMAHGDVSVQGVKRGRLWCRGEVPYVLKCKNKVFSDIDKAQRVCALETRAILNAARTFNDLGVRWRPKTGKDKDYVMIDTTVGRGCAAHIGRVGRVQKLIVHRGRRGSLGCLTKRIIQHEMMHTLGFTHEQNRPDRHKHVKIIWDNIRSGKRHNFRQDKTSLTHCTNYDFGSIMHYRYNAFAKDRKSATIVPLNKNVNRRVLGRTSTLTATDKREVRLTYRNSRKYCN